jgi:hypothetical protein
MEIWACSVGEMDVEPPHSGKTHHHPKGALHTTAIRWRGPRINSPQEDKVEVH